MNAHLFMYYILINVLSFINIHFLINVFLINVQSLIYVPLKLLFWWKPGR